MQPAVQSAPDASLFAEGMIDDFTGLASSSGLNTAYSVAAHVHALAHAHIHQDGHSVM